MSADSWKKNTKIKNANYKTSTESLGIFMKIPYIFEKHEFLDKLWFSDLEKHKENYGYLNFKNIF